MKKIGSLLLTVAFALVVFAGCSQRAANETTIAPETKDVTTEAATAAPVKNVDLKFSIWGSDAHKAMYEDLFAKFKESNPNVSLEVMIIPFGEYQQKMSMFMAANTTPDISWLSDTMIPQFITNDQLVDITSIKDDQAYAFDDIIPATLNPVSKDGKIHGIAFSTPPFVLYYNKTMFTEKGAKTPTEYAKEGKWNYDSMLEAAQNISDIDKGNYGLCVVSKGWKNSWTEAPYSFAWGFGAKVFSEDGKEFLFNTLEAESALQFFSDLIWKYKVHVKPGDQVSFESGKIGMYRNTISYMGTAKKIQDFEWDIAPWPKGPVEGPNLMGYAAYTMIKSGTVKNEAVELLKHFTNQDSMGVTAQYFVPCRSSILSGEAFKKLYPVPAESVDLAILEPMKNGKTLTANPKQVEIENELNIIFDNFYTGKATVKDIIEKINEKVIPLTK